MSLTSFRAVVAVQPLQLVRLHLHLLLHRFVVVVHHQLGLFELEDAAALLPLLGLPAGDLCLVPLSLGLNLLLAFKEVDPTVEHPPLHRLEPVLHLLPHHALLLQRLRLRVHLRGCGLDGLHQGPLLLLHLPVL